MCRAIQMSFLRLLATEAILKQDTQSNAQALAIWNRLARHPRCEFHNSEPAILSARISVGQPGGKPDEIFKGDTVRFVADYANALHANTSTGQPSLRIACEILLRFPSGS
jgi:hypothetical protein